MHIVIRCKYLQGYVGFSAISLEVVRNIYAVQCLPFTVVQLKSKHCRNVVVNMFGNCLSLKHVPKIVLLSNKFKPNGQVKVKKIAEQTNMTENMAQVEALKNI